MKKIFAFIVLGSNLLIGSLFGQNVLDGAFIPENSSHRKVTPYAHLREADVLYSRRIWRVIDVREKMNQPFGLPKTPTPGGTRPRRALIDVIHDGIKNNSLQAYGQPEFDDEFTKPMTHAEIDALFLNMKSMNIEDSTGNPTPKDVPDPIDAQKVKQFLVKEDWYFDKQRSVLDVRIIGICPIKKKISESGEEVANMRLFWIYFPEARPLFAVAEMFNTKNDEERRTYDDVFWKREFSSFIFKESNVFDRKIEDVIKDGRDQLLESDKIKASLFNWEHDLWHF